jgi:transposase
MIKMGRPQPQFTEEDKKKINKELSKSQTPSTYRRLMILKLKSEQRFKSEEIAAILKLHPVTVNKIISKFFKNGIDSICKNNYNPNRKYMTNKEEKEFLEPFIKSAENGHILEVSDIIKAFEKVIGHKVSKNTVYLLLHRNGWRKVMPRSKHPNKAKPEAIEAYKKNS